jgi:small subunit ribosomal protein S8
MTMTDPIADMLTRIRNANSAMFDTVKMPGSKLKESLAGILEREGFIAGYHVEPNPTSRARRWRSPEVLGRPHAHHRRDQADLQARAAHLRPGRRHPRVLGGMGVAVLSTSQGLVTDREARKKHLGGEVLCHVW